MKVISPLESMKQAIRVNHAGEFAAKNIYSAQVRALKKDSFAANLLQHMYEQESVHFDYFDQLIKKYKINKTKLLPLWSLLSTLLGIATALGGKKMAMACTVAVERVIEGHYREQLSVLNDSDLKLNIAKFLDEELEHHDIGLKNGAEQSIFYDLILSLVGKACKVAIELSKLI